MTTPVNIETETAADVAAYLITGVDGPRLSVRHQPELKIGGVADCCIRGNSISTLGGKGMRSSCPVDFRCVFTPRTLVAFDSPPPMSLGARSSGGRMSSSFGCGDRSRSTNNWNTSLSCCRAVHSTL